MYGYLVIHPVTRKRFYCSATDEREARKVAAKHFHFKARNSLHIIAMNPEVARQKEEELEC